MSFLRGLNRTANLKLNANKLLRDLQAKYRNKPLNRIALISFLGAGFFLATTYVNRSIAFADETHEEVSVTVQDVVSEDKTDINLANQAAKDQGCPFPLAKDRKPSLVILGTGWSAMGLLQSISNDFDITIVSPRNYFLFTPLLPGVTTGTVEARSIIEPVRRHCRRLGLNVKYFEAACTDIDPETHQLTCRDVSGLESSHPEFNLRYDHLVIAIGSEPNTFGTPGVTKENVSFLKSIEDAQSIRSRIMDLFETANYPGLSKDEKRDLLRFVIVGGGPTGVEFAAELSDFLADDLSKYFPHLMQDVSVVLVQSGDYILNSFDKSIGQYAKTKFERNNIDVKTNARVKTVDSKEVIVQEKGKATPLSLPYGLVVWSTGISSLPLVTKLLKKIPGQEQNRTLLVDNKLEVKGVSGIYAMGDCATIEPVKLQHHLKDLFKQADANGDDNLSKDEFLSLLKNIKNHYPQLGEYSDTLEDIFEKADLDKNNQLSLEEFEQILKEVDQRVKILPTTAQVAAQQGKYLGSALQAKLKGEPVADFQYRHLGQFAYIGKSAVMELPGNVKGGGYLAWWLWRSVYLDKQVSLKNKMLILFDWFKSAVFGRDISRF